MAEKTNAPDGRDREEKLYRQVSENGSGKKGGSGGFAFKDYLLIALVLFIAFMGMNRYVFSRSADNFFRGSCCQTGVGASRPDGDELSQMGLDFYFKNSPDAPGLEGLEAVVEDFGCHQEIYIYREGQLMMRVGHANGQTYEL